jgi:hypothetical protein
MKKILILSDSRHEEYTLVKGALDSRNISSVLFDVCQFPQKLEIAFEVSNTDVPRLTLQFPDFTIDGSDLGFIWFHRFPVLRNLEPTLSVADKMYMDSECLFFLSALPYLLPRAYCLKPPYELFRSAMKPLQLLKAVEAGLKIPDTIVGNHVDLFRRFSNTHSEIAAKSAYSICVNQRHYQYVPELLRNFIETALLKFPVLNADVMRSFCEGKIQDFRDSFTDFFTEKIRSVEILSSVNAVKNSPVIFQQYIEKEYELRITVIGLQVFACAIFSQEKPEAAHDFRNSKHINELRHTPVNLPSHITKSILHFMQLVGLDYGSIDMIYTATGEYVFLEVNPDGGWGWTESIAGLPISEAMADFMVQKLSA